MVVSQVNTKTGSLHRSAMSPVPRGGVYAAGAGPEGIGRDILDQKCSSKRAGGWLAFVTLNPVNGLKMRVFEVITGPFLLHLKEYSHENSLIHLFPSAAGASAFRILSAPAKARSGVDPCVVLPCR